MRTEPTDLKPAAIYLRRSTDKQEQSLGDQRREIERYAREKDYRLVAEFVDDGVSGTSGETRQGFLDMLEAAKSKSRDWSTILVWDVKRFGRMSSEESGYYLWQFRQAGVSVVYTSEGFTGTPVDRYMQFFKQEAARDESVTLSKAVGRGLVSLAEDGWWTGGPAPYGYDLAIYDQFGNIRCIVRHNDSGGKDVLDPDGRRLWDVPMGQQVKASDKEHARLVPGTPERVEVLGGIFAWYTGTPSLGFKAIADRLNREGVASPRGRGWAQSSIREIIRNDVYVGRTVWNKRSLGKFHRISKRTSVERDGCGRRKKTWNDPTDWIIREDSHEALISRETFDRAQRLMKERADRCNAPGWLGGKGRNSPYLLSGLVKCSVCGGSMHGRTTRKGRPRKDGTYARNTYYVCGQAITKGKAVCQPIPFVQAPLDDLILQVVADQFRAFLGKNGRATLKKLVDQELAEEGSDPRPEIRRLKTRLAEIQTKVDSVIDLAAESPEHRDALSGRLTRLKDDRRQIEERLKELDLVPVRVTKTDAIVDSVLAGLEDARRLFECGRIEERKRVIRTFVDGLVLSGAERVGQLRIRQIPTVGYRRDSVEVVAGVRFEPTT